MPSFSFLQSSTETRNQTHSLQYQWGFLLLPQKLDQGSLPASQSTWCLQYNSSSLICLPRKAQTLPFAFFFKSSEASDVWVEDICHRCCSSFSFAKRSVQGALLGCINHTPTIAATFGLMREREINCWQTIRTDGFFSLTCHSACTANCHGIIYLCYQHPGLSKN